MNKTIFARLTGESGFRIPDTEKSISGQESFNSEETHL